MLTSTLLSLLSTPLSTPAPTPSAFLPAVRVEDSQNALFRLQRRQNACPMGYAGCESLNFPNICCLSNAVCTPDGANHVACCPSGALCTGTVGGTSLPTATAGGPVAAAVGAPTNGFAFGANPALLAPATSYNLFGSASIPTFAASTVVNPFFPFIYIPTSFVNAAVCSSYFTACGTEFSSCASSLGGGVINGVTVTGAGGGVTVQGATATSLSQGASICSSLSSQGCYGLQLTNCPAFGGAETGIVVAVGGSEHTRPSGFGMMVVLTIGMILACS